MNASADREAHPADLRLEWFECFASRSEVFGREKVLGKASRQLLSIYGIGSSVPRAVGSPPSDVNGEAQEVCRSWLVTMS